MTRGTLVALLLLGAAHSALAQASLAPPAADFSPAPPGPRQPRAPMPPPEVAEPAPSAVLGRGWQEFEWLLWWTRDARVPPLATAGQTTAVGPTLDSRDQSGGRFTLGFSLDSAQTVGLEGSYFFLGTRTTTYSAAGTGAPGTLPVGVPYLDVADGAERALVLAAAGESRGVLDVSASSRLQGAELNAVANVLAGMHYQLDALVGFRYFELNEGIQIAARTAPLGGDPAAGTSFADQFDGHNRFYGGQVGVRGELRKGLLFLGVTAKLGLGDVQEVVRISGVSREPGAGLQRGGLFAAGSNSGRHARDAFGLLPEAAVRLGFHLGPRTRFFLGYNVIYLSDAARPGDQIDRGLDPAQIPVLAGATVPAERPRFNFNSTDFWVQGLVVGLEYRY
jgi:hypothetical protein